MAIEHRIDPDKDATQEKGLECRRCGCRHFYTIYTRPCIKGIRRRRECRNCGLRATTYERKS